MADGLITRREISVRYDLSRSATERRLHSSGLKPGYRGGSGFVYELSEVERVFNRPRHGLAAVEIDPVTDATWARFCEVWEDFIHGRCWPKQNKEAFEDSQRQSPRTRLNQAV